MNISYPGSKVLRCTQLFFLSLVGFVVKLHSDREDKFRSMQTLVFHYQLCVWHLSLLFSYNAQICCLFSGWVLSLALDHGAVAVDFDIVTFIVLIRLLKEILQKPTISKYLRQLTNNLIRLLNNGLDQGCQTHFTSRATSGIFNLKWAGPVKSLHNILLKVMPISNCFYNFNAKISSLFEIDY